MTVVGLYQHLIACSKSTLVVAVPTFYRYSAALAYAAYQIEFDFRTQLLPLR